MKKAAIFFSALTLTIIVYSCGAKDNKNEVEPYPTTDTTQHMEHKNDEARHDSTGANSH